KRSPRRTVARSGWRAKSARGRFSPSRFPLGSSKLSHVNLVLGKLQRRAPMRLAPSDLLGAALGLTFLMGAAPVAIGTEPAQFGTPKGDEGTRIFKTTEHPNYSGQFRLTGQGTVLVGSMQDRPPWDHLDYAGKRLNSVSGRISIEVDERANSGRVLVEF